MTDGPVHQEILFIDSFTHQNSESIHWDHIKFNHPVYIEQIRIIPENCSVQLANGLLHRGLTLPKKFHIDFYSNNLNKKDQECSTLDKFGSLNYEDNYSNDASISLTLKPPQMPVDWLLITGCYWSLSILVIGSKVQPTMASNFRPVNNSSIITNSNLLSIPRSLNNRLPIRNSFTQRHHPYLKTIAQTPKQEIEIKDEALEEKIEIDNLDENCDEQEDTEEIVESSIVKLYLNLDETRDENEIKDSQKYNNQINTQMFDPFEFRLGKFLEKKKQKFDGINIQLEWLIENLNEDLLEYLIKFKQEIHFNLKSKDIKLQNLIFKLCKLVWEKYSGYLIDEQLNLSPIVVDLIIDYLNEENFHQLFKSVSLLNIVLNSGKSMQNFCSENYDRFLNRFEQKNPHALGSRLTYSIGRLLLKIQFNQNLVALNELCSNLNSSDLNKILYTYESILVYCFQNLIRDDFNCPLQPLFMHKTNENSEIINYFEYHHFFTNTLKLWSLQNEQLCSVIENFFEQFFLPSESNNFSFNNIKYLTRNTKLTNCIFQICLSKTECYSKTVLRISHAVYLVDLLESLIENFSNYKISKKDLLLLNMVGIVQDIDFLFNEKSDYLDFLIEFMSKPDGNFSNKYFKILVEFFDYLIDDNLESDLRCYAMNSVTNVLTVLCSKNQNWTIVDPKEYYCIKKLNMLSSTLINKLIMTILKPSTDKNQSFFKLIEKLKIIMSTLEPFYIYKDGEKNFLNFIIDSFREQIDKNLNLYMGKYMQSASKILNYLNSNVTQLVLLKNVLKPSKKLNDKLNKKILLGNLINRNLCHVLINFLARLNDYIQFYSAKCDLKYSQNIVKLIEPSVWLIKIIVLNLFKVQQKKFNDFYIVEVLLEFYTNLDRVLKEQTNVKKDLFDIFSVYAKYRQVKFYDTLSKYALKKPENFLYSLNVLNETLSHSSITDFASLFKQDPHKYLIQDQCYKDSNFVIMLRYVCLSTELSPIFLNICQKMINDDLIRVFVDYSIELIGEIKSNFNLNEVEIYQKQDEIPKEDLLYDTNIVELSFEDEIKEAPQQDNSNDFKKLLIKKFILVSNFLVNFLNLNGKDKLVKLCCQSEKCDDKLVRSDIDYSDYIPGLLRYFNQIDFNIKSSTNINELCQIQEVILDLSFFLIEDIDETLLAKVLVDHLGSTRFDHYLVSMKCLNCLIKLKSKDEIIKNHFQNESYLTNFINELASKLKCLTLLESIEIMNKLFSYLKILIINLLNQNDGKKIWTLFQWTVKNSNDSLIDSISMSSSVLNGNLQHFLINLDKNIELYYNSLNDEESKKKFKSIVNQSSFLIKFLNEYDQKFLGFFGEGKSEMDYQRDHTSNDFDFNLDLNEPIELILMSDKELYKKLKSNLEDYPTQSQIGEDSEEKNSRLKTPDVINTRTGIRYKAPMRGGHSNPTSRALPSSNSVPSMQLLANPVPANGLTRTDSFRTRPQNTSRPPSLHVDDFYRIEQQQKQMNTEVNGSSENLSRNNSDLGFQQSSFSQEELNIQTECLQPQNYNPVNNVISPQIKQSITPNTQQNQNGQFMNQIGPSLLKTLPPQFNNMNQRQLINVPFNQSEGLNRQFQYNNNNGQVNEINNGLLYINQNINENLMHNPSALSPNQPIQSNQQIMNNQAQHQQQQQQQQQTQPIPSVLMQNQMFNTNYRFTQPNQNRGGGHLMPNTHMFRGGMRRGITIPNLNQMNQNFVNGNNNYIRPTSYQNQNQFQQHQR